MIFRVLEILIALGLLVVVYLEMIVPLVKGEKVLPTIRGWFD